MNDASIAPVDPRCEYKRNPLGIDVSVPRLSWKLASDARAQAQSAYQVLVATREDLLEEGKADLWDSGKVISNDSSQVAYAGLPQERHIGYCSSLQRRYWKVRVWDGEDRVSDWSETAWWEYGLLTRPDWTATTEWKNWWMGLEAGPIVDDLQPVLYLRRDFTLAKPIRRARLYATALGLYKLYTNGSLVSEDIFTPGFTDYHRHVLYQGYDVTDLLRETENTLGVVLAGGWFCGWCPFGGYRSYGERPRALVHLYVEYEDETVEVVVSDDTWKGSTGPILASDLYAGETYDARLEAPGWAEPGFDCSDWKSVDTCQWGTVPLEAQQAPPIRRIEELNPIAMQTAPDGKTIVDLGQNFAGWVRLKVRGEAGDTVVMRFGEWLNTDGSLWTGNLGSAKATDTYILKGTGEEIYEPSFTYHGFRYVEVSGYPGELTEDALTGIVVHADCELTGTFECSSDMINKIHEATKWGQRSNYLSVPTDCPQRSERAGWTGDAQIFARTGTFIMDSAAFLAKWIVDVRKAQSNRGAYTDFAPRSITAWDGDGAPAWADAGIIVPWVVYEAYGDTRVIRKHYASMQLFMNYIGEVNPNYLRQNRCNHNMADWLNVDAYTGWDVLATAFWAYDAMLMSRMARAIGREDDATRYDELFARIKAAFNGAYVSDDGRIMGENVARAPGETFERKPETDNQTGYVLALAYGLLDGDIRRAAGERLVERIEQRDWHLSTGFNGVRFLLPVLADIGRLDVAYRLLETETLPSWGYMVQSGATTIWERWDGWTGEKGPQASLNHFAFGSVCEWLYTAVAGIDTDADRPGYKHIVLCPLPGGSLTWTRAEYESIHGRIASHWRRENGAFHWEVTVPPNTAATAHVPVGESGNVTEGGQPVEKAPGVTFERTEGDRAIYALGSGTYRFESDWA